jgi:hypothetical protein
MIDPMTTTALVRQTCALIGSLVVVAPFVDPAVPEESIGT